MGQTIHPHHAGLVSASSFTTTNASEVETSPQVSGRETKEARDQRPPGVRDKDSDQGSGRACCAAVLAQFGNFKPTAISCADQKCGANNEQGVIAPRCFQKLGAQHATRKAEADTPSPKPETRAAGSLDLPRLSARDADECVRRVFERTQGGRHRRRSACLWPS